MSEINVLSTKQRIVVDPASYSVSVISTGLPGPPGPTGNAVQRLTISQRNALTGADLYRGLMIFNIDTGGVEVYYGTVTGWRAPWNTAWGLAATATQIGGTSPSISTITDVPGLGVTFNHVVGRRYRAHTQLLMATSAPNLTPHLIIRDAANAVLFDWWNLSQQNGTIFPASVFYTPNTGTASTLKVAISTTGGTVQSFEAAGGPSARLVIDDIGPIGNAPAHNYISIRR
jgi:hypothetical protein